MRSINTVLTNLRSIGKLMLLMPVETRLWQDLQRMHCTVILIYHNKYGIYYTSKVVMKHLLGVQTIFLHIFISQA